MKAAKLDQQVSELGGRAAYQAASELTTSKHRVSKWVFSVLTELGLRPSKGQPPLPLLEVGSLAMPQTAEGAEWVAPCLSLRVGCPGSQPSLLLLGLHTACHPLCCACWLRRSAACFSLYKGGTATLRIVKGPATWGLSTATAANRCPAADWSRQYAAAQHPVAGDKGH